MPSHSTHRMKGSLVILLLLAASSAAVVPAMARDAVIAFNNEAQQLVREYGIPSQLASKVRAGAPSTR